MKDLPIAVRMVANIFLYGVYVLVSSIFFSLLFPLMQKMLGNEIWMWDDPRFAKIQLLIIAAVLVLTLIGRKYFYIFGKKEALKTPRSPQIEKKIEVPVVHEVPNTSLGMEESSEDEIKIYIEKEIK